MIQECFVLARVLPFSCDCDSPWANDDHHERIWPFTHLSLSSVRRLCPSRAKSGGTRRRLAGDSGISLVVCDLALIRVSSSSYRRFRLHRPGSYPGLSISRSGVLLIIQVLA
jgi:hypothetical protein